MSKPLARGPSQKSGTIPQPLPRVSAENGGHLWRPHQSELKDLSKWLQRLGAPAAEKRDYPVGVVIVRVEGPDIQSTGPAAIGSGSICLAIQDTDWSGLGGVQAILAGQFPGVGRKEQPA